MIKTNLKNLNLTNKRVFLRADLNVPLKNGNILDDYRLKAILPTIDLIQKHGGKVILATHIDRPTEFNPELSTKNLINWFKDKGYQINFEPDLNKAYNESFTNWDNILLLENLRFFEGEQKHSKKFALELARLADFYVNDAFGLLHREDSSITLVPEFFEKNKRTIGLLIEKELNALNKLIKNAEHPFLLILGGGKVEDKIILIKNLLNKVNEIQLLPAIVFTFLKAQGKTVGQSLVAPDLLDCVASIEKDAAKKNVKLFFPKDYIIAKDTFKGKLSILKRENFDNFENYFGISIGPKTAELFSQSINDAKTIFFNGLPGDLSRPETLENIKILFRAMANSKAYTYICGGDSVAAARILGFEKQIRHLSTGGGSVLTYLSGKELPGLKFFN